MNQGETFQFEKKRFENVVNKIKKQLENSKKNFDSHKNYRIGFTEGLRGTQFTRQALMSMYATDINYLSSVLKEPYFGRFDFADLNKNIKEIYIGKKSVIDSEGNIIAYDWRSDICSMYYDYAIGPAQFIENNKIKSGEILLKRQFKIENGELVDLTEQDTISNDSFLVDYLSENSDSRLKSIIATIQKEQNTIIRNKDNNYIIQGIAGSGKTTVALHRLAYLLYNNSKNNDESEYLIIGPNNYFLDYISEVLPELDINNVSQSTFEEIAMNTLKIKGKVKTKNDILNEILSKKIDEKIIEYKNSIPYLKSINNFIDFYVVSHLQEPIKIGDFEICSVSDLKIIYDETAYNFQKSYHEKIDLFSKRLIKKIKDNYDKYYADLYNVYREKILSFPMDDPKRYELINYVDQLLKELKTGCKKVISNYFKFIKVNSITLYKIFLSEINNFGLPVDIDVDEIKENTMSNINKKTFTSDDLAALLFIDQTIGSNLGKENYSHIFIDEGQDLSMTQYYVLKQLYPNSIYNIFGDTNQAIYDYQSNDWEIINNDIFSSNAIQLNLNKSYRTTKQIFDSSNYLLKDNDKKQNTCVAREGSNVVVNKQDSKKLINDILEQIHYLLNKNYNSIAIVCKDEDETKQVYDLMNKCDISCNLITDVNQKYRRGISILPSYLTKGLEFDAVIIYNASREKYSDNNIDKKLLYVIMTRAMHDLYVNYSDEITMPLSNLLFDKKLVLNYTK